MDFLVMQRQLRAARRGRMAFGMTLGLMLGINGLLAAKLYFTSNQVVLVPSTTTSSGCTVNTLLRSSRSSMADVTYTRSQPNGDGCGPICRYATADLTVE